MHQRKSLSLFIYLFIAVFLLVLYLSRRRVVQQKKSSELFLMVSKNALKKSSLDFVYLFFTDKVSVTWDGSAAEELTVLYLDRDLVILEVASSPWVFQVAS